MIRRVGSVAALAILVGVAAVVGALTWSSDPTSDEVVAAPPPAPLGPQGLVPQFVVECGLSHSSPDDPIVHPGHHGGSHLHDFFGATTTGANSTPETLLAGDTTCKDRGDTAAYWAPALLDGGEPVVARRSVAYYRPGPDVEPEAVEPWPFGLVMLAGDPDATEDQPLGVVAWHCGASEQLTATPPACPQGAELGLRVTFPDCWDGDRLDSHDHRSHVAYSRKGTCPDTHPVSMVQLVFQVDYPVHGDPNGLSLASGHVRTAHADVVNAWDPDRLAQQVRLCLNRAQVCGVSGSS